jgi:hypothetical protein
MIMIGVSTQQNITNLIPAVQVKGITLFLMMQSQTAQQNNWSENIKKVLKERKIELITINLDKNQDKDIELMVSKINLVLKRYENQKIHWNIGGGLKIHNLAMFLAYSRRENKEDVICYANQDTNPSLEFLTQEDGKICNNPIPINVDLTAEEIFNLNGISIEEKSAKLIYSKRVNCIVDGVMDLMKFKEFRKYFFMVSALRVLGAEKYDLKFNEESLNSVLRDNGELIVKQLMIELRESLQNKAKQLSHINQITNNQVHLNEVGANLKNRIFGNNDKNGFLQNIIFNYEDTVEFTDKELINILKLNSSECKLKLDYSIFQRIKSTKPPEYFEKIVISRIHKILNSKGNYVFEAYSNVKTKMKDRVGTLAEYDILLVTQWGTVIAIDAKTFDFEAKDIDARFFNLEQSAGKFMKFHVVAPYDPEDFQEKYFTQKLRELPQKCNERKMTFFALSDSTKTEDFNVEYKGQNVTKVESNQGVKISNFESILTVLKLI